MLSRFFFPRHFYCCFCFKVNNYHSNVIQRASIIGLQNYALSTKMWLIQVVLDKCDCFFITKSVPQTICGQDHKARLCFLQIKSQYIWFSNDQISVFEWEVPKCSGGGKNTSNPPYPIKTDEPSSLLDPLSFFQLSGEEENE